MTEQRQTHTIKGILVHYEGRGVHRVATPGLKIQYLKLRDDTEDRAAEAIAQAFPKALTVLNRGRFWGDTTAVFDVTLPAASDVPLVTRWLPARQQAAAIVETAVEGLMQLANDTNVTSSNTADIDYILELAHDLRVMVGIDQDGES